MQYSIFNTQFHVLNYLHYPHNISHPQYTVHKPSFFVWVIDINAVNPRVTLVIGVGHVIYLV